MYEAKKGWVSFDARMNATSTPPTEDTPNKRSWNKGARVLLGLALLGGIWGARLPILEQALVAVARQAGWSLEVDGLTLSAMPWSLGVDRLVLHDEASGTEVAWHRLAIAGVHRQGGGWRIDDVRWRRLDIQAMPSTTPDGGSSPSLPKVQVSQLAWDTLSVAWADTVRMALHEGVLSGAQVDNDTWQVNHLGWNKGWGTTAPFRDTLLFSQAALAGKQTDETLALRADNIALPGLEAHGRFSWPLDSTQGRVAVNWDEAKPWLAMLGNGALAPWLAYMEGNTAFQWNQNLESWTAEAQGSHWLNFVAEGSADNWRIRTTLPGEPLGLPEVAKAWRIDAQGTLAANTDAFLPYVDAASAIILGDSAIDLRASWAPLPQEPPMVLAGASTLELRAWPGWVVASRDTVRLHVFGRPESFAFQAEASFPEVRGNLQGNKAGNRVTVDGRVQGRMTGSFEEDVVLRGSWDARNGWLGGTTSMVAKGSLLDSDSLALDAAFNDLTRLEDVAMSLTGAGIEASLEGNVNPTSWSAFLNEAMHRSPTTTWPALAVQGTVAHRSWMRRWLPESLAWQEPLEFDMLLAEDTLNGHVGVQAWSWDDLHFEPTTVTLSGDPDQLNMDGRLSASGSAWMPERVDLIVQADSAWHMDLEWEHEGWAKGQWAMDAKPGSQQWTWAIREGHIPIAEESLTVDKVPVTWQAALDKPLPPLLAFQGLGGLATMRSSPHLSGGQSVDLQAKFPDLEELVHVFVPDLDVHGFAVDAQWNPVNASVRVVADDVAWEAIQLDQMSAGLKTRPKHLLFDVEASQTADTVSAKVSGKMDASTLAFSQTTMEAFNLPFAWLESFIDPVTAELQGRLDAELSLTGTPSLPRLQGLGKVRGLEVKVGSLGTSFGGSGDVLVEPDGFTMNNWLVHDQEGETFRVYGALMHEQFQEWNMDLNCLESQNALHLMDLPYHPEAMVYGSLFGTGSFGVSFWDNHVEIDGEATVLEGTDLQLPLYQGATSSWEDVVHFTKSFEEAPLNGTADASNLRMAVNLNIDVDREAQVTLVLDDINDANMVGQMEGHLDFYMDNEERMDLKGALTIVEGRYDFALGQFLRKRFEAQPGGRLEWDGDVYEGTMSVDAVHQTRANISPLIGTSGGGQQFEAIDVVLHLSGPMLAPNIAFDLRAPEASPLNQEALSSALMNESDVTSQAIALLSLQEFIPSQVNGLQLGAEGIQENSINLIASQVSGWLSRVNDDVEVGISYDALGETSDASDIISRQDALQLAMKAKFLNDKLEVEGAVGSQDLSQESLSQTHLQNLRVLYNLNDDHSLQLTGFSRSQNAATQNASSTTQGIGVRWHQAFSWKWPWRQSKESDPNSD